MSKYVILLEDDGDDISLVKETLAELEMNVRVQYFARSLDMFRFLQETDEKPALILVDFNLQPDTGLAVLKKIRSDAQWNNIPVVMLSDNNLDRYKNECYRLGASSYIQKPSTLAGTRKKITSFFEYWTEVVEI
jgi:two-component system response regulator